MSGPDPADVRRVVCVGAGTIGGGWAAQFLSRGYDVAAWDPAPDGADRLRAQIDAAWPALTDLGLASGASRDRLSITATLAEAVDGAAFIQEGVPEVIDVKIEALAEIDAAAAPDAIIASSTSGFSMTDMQVRCAHPERTVVGHPFNPVYLIPLVEVVPGAKTDPAAATWAAAFYERAGKSAIIVKDQVYGFLANRLQEALWREALYMIRAGEATSDDLDRCISEGPGLRWAVMGPFLTFHLGGGPGGLGAFFDKFEGEGAAPYSRLPGPELTPELRAAVLEGTDRLVGGRSFEELVAERDRCLVAFLKVVAEGRSEREAPTPSQE
jgi:carnitine 3-dehydrogenase